MERRHGENHMCKNALTVIVVTRWTSVSDCLGSFLFTNFLSNSRVYDEERLVGESRIDIISHPSVCTDIEHLHSTIEALGYAATLIQSRPVTLAECYLILTEDSCQRIVHL